MRTTNKAPGHAKRSGIEARQRSATVAKETVRDLTKIRADELLGAFPELAELLTREEIEARLAERPGVRFVEAEERGERAAKGRTRK